MDFTITVENKILIDKLVRSENEIEIMDIVKKLVPEATEFTFCGFPFCKIGRRLL